MSRQGTPLLTELIQHTECRLARHDFVKHSIPSRFQQCEGRLDVHLTALFWAHPNGSQVKGTYTFGPRSEILNIMIYPRDATIVPVLAADYIVFGGKLFVVFLDLQPAGGLNHPLMADLRENVQPLHDRFMPLLTPGGELPGWATSLCTPACLFVRPKSVHEQGPLVEAYHSYLDCWLEVFLQRETGRMRELEHVITYLNHHVTHTPGRRILVSTFGDTWTEDFLNEFLYAISEVG